MYFFQLCGIGSAENSTLVKSQFALSIYFPWTAFLAAPAVGHEISNNLPKYYTLYPLVLHIHESTFGEINFAPVQVKTFFKKPLVNKSRQMAFQIILTLQQNVTRLLPTGGMHFLKYVQN